MTYSNDMKDDIVDDVNITLYDGQGDECFSGDLLNPDAIYENKCYISSLSIQVHVKSNPEGSSSFSLSDSTALLTLYNAIIGGSALLILLCLWCCCIQGPNSFEKSEGCIDDDFSTDFGSDEYDIRVYLRL